MVDYQITTIAEIAGPWVESDFESSLVSRCRNAWNKPLAQLTNQELATLLRQEIAVDVLAPLAATRLEAAVRDDSECYDDELANALQKARTR
jgi:hypothetical protein